MKIFTFFWSKINTMNAILIILLYFKCTIYIIFFFCSVLNFDHICVIKYYSDGIPANHDIIKTYTIKPAIADSTLRWFLSAAYTFIRDTEHKYISRCINRHSLVNGFYNGNFLSSLLYIIHHLMVDTFHSNL